MLYADSGFAVGQNMITPFRRRGNQSEGEAEWNRYVSLDNGPGHFHICNSSEMSRHRISVEWGIGRCKNLFQMMTNKV